MIYTIENDVPLPTTSGKGRKAIYPLAQMEVGQSFRFPHDKRVRHSILRCANAIGKGVRQYATRTVQEDGKTWFRIWRVK